VPPHKEKFDAAVEFRTGKERRAQWRKKAERFKGTRQGEWVANFLNSENSQEKPNRELIETLIRDLHRYLDRGEEYLQNWQGGREPGSPHPDEIAEEIANYIEEHFRPTVGPRYSPLEIGPSPRMSVLPSNEFEAPPVIPGNIPPNTVKLRRWEAFSNVCDLFDFGRIRNLFMCELCEKWMFAKFPSGKKRQRVHKGKCHKEWMTIKMRLYMKHQRKFEATDRPFNGTRFFELGHCLDYEDGECEICEREMTGSISGKTVEANTGLHGKTHKDAVDDERRPQRTSRKRRSRGPQRRSKLNRQKR
jgi:hypothetical protein